MRAVTIDAAQPLHVELQSPTGARSACEIQPGTDTHAALVALVQRAAYGSVPVPKGSADAAEPACVITVSIGRLEAAERLSMRFDAEGMTVASRGEGAHKVSPDVAAELRGALMRVLEAGAGESTAEPSPVSPAAPSASTGETCTAAVGRPARRPAAARPARKACLHIKPADTVELVYHVYSGFPNPTRALPPGSEEHAVVRALLQRLLDTGAPTSAPQPPYFAASHLAVIRGRTVVQLDARIPGFWIDYTAAKAVPRETFEEVVPKLLAYAPRLHGDGAR